MIYTRQVDARPMAPTRKRLRISGNKKSAPKGGEEKEP